ncbi:hypothetical protein [Corynebacterium faecale]|uniref:hypothetical protein n=1 Tax=Corynebacterium faecale TaxID=1758466 RepID=UPI0025B4B892|nr:hypothetical protein [Corynebacterium faecale]
MSTNNRGGRRFPLRRCFLSTALPARRSRSVLADSCDLAVPADPVLLDFRA